MQEEVCIVPAPPVCLLPVCSYARLTAYFGILPTRLPILSERDFTPSSSARGATLAVMASSVSRILPGQEYSIVTAIAAGGAYCNAPPLIPQVQKRKMGTVKYFSQKHLCQNEVQRRKVRQGGCQAPLICPVAYSGGAVKGAASAAFIGVTGYGHADP